MWKTIMQIDSKKNKVIYFLNLINNFSVFFIVDFWLGKCHDDYILEPFSCQRGHKEIGKVFIKGV